MLAIGLRMLCATTGTRAPRAACRSLSMRASRLADKSRAISLIACASCATSWAPCSRILWSSCPLLMICAPALISCIGWTKLCFRLRWEYSSNPAANTMGRGITKGAKPLQYANLSSSACRLFEISCKNSPNAISKSPSIHSS